MADDKLANTPVIKQHAEIVVTDHGTKHFKVADTVFNIMTLNLQTFKCHISNKSG
jgi:hypothetical protein